MNVLLLVFFIPIYVFTLTLYPTVGGGDSGELTTVANTLGIAHPPGYPLYTLLGYLFSKIPYGSVAWRINFLSAFFSSMTCIFIYLSGKELCKSLDKNAQFIPKSSIMSNIICLSGALLTIFTPLIWRYSVVAEVFSLNNFFLIIIIYQFLKYQNSKDFKWLIYGPLTLGLSISHHHTIILMIFPFCVWAFYNEIFVLKRKTLLKASNLLKIFSLFLLGLTPYLYLPIRSSFYPIISWGKTHTWNGFWEHLLRKNYGSGKLALMDTPAEFLKNTLIFIKETPGEFLYLGFFISIYFIFASIRNIYKNKIVTFEHTLIISSIFYILIFHSLANLPLDNKLYYQVHIRFWQLNYIVLGLLFICGCKYIVNYLFQKNLLNSKLVNLSIIILLLMPVVQIFINFKKEDQSQNYTFKEFGKHFLDSVEKDAILLSLGDIVTNSVRYMQYCENYRTDVITIDRELSKQSWMTKIINQNYPEVVYPKNKFYYYPNSSKKIGKYSYHLGEFFESNISKKDIYITHIKSNSLEGKDKRWHKNFINIPHGLTYKIKKKNYKNDYKSYLNLNNKIINKINSNSIKNIYDGSWEQLVWKDLSSLHFFSAVYLLNDFKIHQKNKNMNKNELDELLSLSSKQFKTFLNLPQINFKKQFDINFKHPLKMRQQTIVALKYLALTFEWKSRKTVNDYKNIYHIWKDFIKLNKISKYKDKDLMKIKDYFYKLELNLKNKKVI